MKNKSNHVHHPHVQGRIFLYLRIFYKKYLSFLGVNKILKLVIEKLVGVVANLKNFNFPSKYPWDWKLEMLLYRFEAETVGLAKDIIKPGMTVIDVGAHIGYFTRLFSQLVGPSGKVIAFEPISENFEILQKNTEKFSNIKLYNYAVGDNIGTTIFYKVLGRSACHSLLKPSDHSQEVVVPITTIDELVKLENLHNINFIKIDVEGSEFSVLKGAWQSLSKFNDINIVMEFNKSFFKDDPDKPLDFFESLEDLGFKLFSIQGGMVESFNKASWQDFEYANEEYVNILCRKL